MLLIFDQLMLNFKTVVVIIWKILMSTAAFLILHSNLDRSLLLLSGILRRPNEVSKFL